MLENLMGNTAILWAAARLFGWQIKGWRILLAGAIGVLYAVVEIWLGGVASMPIVKFLAAAVMVLIALPGGNFRGFLLRVSVFYAMTFLLGGGVIALIYLTGRQGAAAMLSAGLLCVLMVEALARAWKKRSAKSTVRLKVQVDTGYTFALTALIDTGAAVCEPISGAPVLMVNQDALVLPPVLADALEGLKCDHLDAVRRYRIRMVPYRPLGKEAKVTAAFCPDQIWIDGARCQGVYIAPIKDELSAGKEYNALAPPAILAIAGIQEGSCGKWSNGNG